MKTKLLTALTASTLIEACIILALHLIFKWNLLLMFGIYLSITIVVMIIFRNKVKTIINILKS